jgi:hypothetical protein
MVQLTKQLALFLENKPGTLARLCEALDEARINVLALSTGDTVDHCVVRLVLSDPGRAARLIEARGAVVVENEVLLVQADNKPGTLGRIARKLAEAKINIDYAYCASVPDVKRGLLVIRVNNPKRAMQILNL